MYTSNSTQRHFVRKGIKSDFRLDGRKNTQFRTIDIQKGVLNQAQGSALLTLKYEQVSMYASVKLQVLKRQSREESNSNIVLSIDSLKRRKEDSEGQVDDASQITLIEELFREMFLPYIQVKDLQIENCTQYRLKAFVDVFLLNYVHRSHIDLIYQVIKAALQDLRVPVFKVLRNEITNEEDIQIMDESRPFKALFPDLFVVGELEGQLVCDLNQLEFESVDNLFAFSVHGDKLLGIRQLGGQFEAEMLLKVIRFATKTHYAHGN